MSYTDAEMREDLRQRLPSVVRCLKSSRPNWNWAKCGLDQTGTGPNGVLTKLELDQTRLRPNETPTKLELDQTNHWRTIGEPLANHWRTQPGKFPLTRSCIMDYNTYTHAELFEAMQFISIITPAVHPARGL